MAYESPAPKEVRAFLIRHHLSGVETGLLLDVDARTVRHWTKEGTKKPMPWSAWTLLRLLIGETTAANVRQQIESWRHDMGKEKKFESELGRAKIMTHVETDPAMQSYWLGYQHGLSRGYYGDRFGDPGEHEAYMAIPPDEPDVQRRERGQGYRDGLAFFADSGGDDKNIIVDTRL